ncbi:carbohydrate ABC transporter permease [Nonomuraea gerenzanensis]|uniref:N-Acetyl-D-glucosamine ABC transport system, permease protein 1 n=1 Tax=Nonomuraea gerenzanensis TaxID=93944 RepID=A0A1M4E7X7_9ACTN|nr:sugar ABC transporter permease [Nonomuraea gerenzanensis]UBU17112.1 sugar ABC transporter permease [Nonomuraea gerenzanensis]SBO94848.1 N-Acetyl-D-glucosamine ABC transport system, permease protein 1 [Nonomuraea gerenzanensis]
MTATLTRAEPAPFKPAFKHSAEGGQGRHAVLFLLPALIGFAAFYLYPSVRGVWLSVTDWNLLSEPAFVGLDNYAELATDPLFWKALLLTAYNTVLNLVGQLTLALLLAALMHRLTKSVVLRATLLLPWLVPNVATALLWLWLLDANLGFVNQLLNAMGLPTHGFFNAPAEAMPSVAAVTTWASVGYVALLLYAGMLQIPASVYEAAAMDGAGEVRTFFRVTLPLLRPVLALVLVVSVIGCFQIFDTIAVATRGGPVNATKVIYYYIYQEAFTHFRMGYAAAMALSLVLILGVLTWVQMRLMRASDSDLG